MDRLIRSEYVSNFPLTSTEILVHRRDCPRLRNSRHVLSVLGARSLDHALDIESVRVGQLAHVRKCQVCEARED